MPAKAPNIVLTIADDQRFDMLGALGRNPCRTPHLDRLIARGTLYTHAHTMGSTHGAVCAPSRAMLHTGRNLYRIPDAIKGRARWTRQEDPEDGVPILGEELRKRGYDCFGTGKWHNGKRAFARGFAGGATVFFGGMSDHFDVPLQDYDPDGLYANEWRSGGQHSTEVFAESARRFLRARAPGGRPFFLYCAFTAPHDPRRTFPEWHRQYDPARLELPPNFAPAHPFDNGHLAGRDERLAPFPRTPEAVRRHLADYYAMTSHMDDAIGRIHAALDEAGLAGETLVIHTADHGLAVGQHGLLGKQNQYDHSIRVPLIAAGPGFQAGLRDGRLCYLHDLFPTLLRAAGAQAPAGGDFDDLQTAPARRTIFSAYEDLMRSVKDERHKLIEYYVGSERHTQLFDLHADPWETRDLSNDAAHAAILCALRQELEHWRKKCGDPA